MLKVLIENLTFPQDEVKLINCSRNEIFEIFLEDYSQGKNFTKYDKWINLCGSLQNSVIEELTIGKNHFNHNFIYGKS